MSLGDVASRRMVALALVWALGACATAGKENPDQVDSSVADPPDASVIVTYDARPQPDAYRPPDARPPPDAYRPPDAAQPPDAAAGGFCDGNEDCIASECCYIMLCVPGTRVGALCFPIE